MKKSEEFSMNFDGVGFSGIEDGSEIAKFGEDELENCLVFDDRMTEYVKKINKCDSGGMPDCDEL